MIGSMLQASAHDTQVAEACSRAQEDPSALAPRSSLSTYVVRMDAASSLIDLTVGPANEVSWADLQAVFGTRGDLSRCFCQRYKMAPRESWASVGAEELASRFREQTECGNPRSSTTSGLVAFFDGEAPLPSVSQAWSRRSVHRVPCGVYRRRPVDPAQAP